MRLLPYSLVAAILVSASACGSDDENPTVACGPVDATIARGVYGCAWSQGDVGNPPPIEPARSTRVLAHARTAENAARVQAMRADAAATMNRQPYFTEAPLAEVRTNDRGIYALALPVGDYWLCHDDCQHGWWPDALEAIHVEAGAIQRLDLAFQWPDRSWRRLDPAPAGAPAPPSPGSPAAESLSAESLSDGGADPRREGLALGDFHEPAAPAAALQPRAAPVPGPR